MRGYKGRVHLHFSKPLTGHYESAEAMALAMDEAIVGELKVYPSNVHASQACGLWDEALERSLSQAAEPNSEASSDALEFFTARVSSIASEKQPYLLMQYANLLRNRLELGLSADSQLAQISNR